jgi:hypothetical protein
VWLAKKETSEGTKERAVSLYPASGLIEDETDPYRESILTLYRSMAVPWFPKPPSISDELGRLVQDQLSKVPRTNTLDDLRTMIKTLSTFTSTCESVLEDISAQEPECDLVTAVKEIGNVLAWAKCSLLCCLNTFQRRADVLLLQFLILLRQLPPNRAFSSARTSM